MADVTVCEWENQDGVTVVGARVSRMVPRAAAAGWSRDS